MIDLTEEQAQTLEAQREGPALVRNPRTQETFVLVRQGVYERVRAIIADINERADWDDPAFDVYDRAES